MFINTKKQYVRKLVNELKRMLLYRETKSGIQLFQTKLFPAQLVEQTHVRIQPTMDVQQRYLVFIILTC